MTPFQFIVVHENECAILVAEDVRSANFYVDTPVLETCRRSLATVYQREGKVDECKASQIAKDLEHMFRTVTKRAIVVRAMKWQTISQTQAFDEQRLVEIER